MKVNELRTALGKYDAAALREIVVELYKMMPKARKDDSSLDELLLNFDRAKAKSVKTEAPLDFESLRAEVEQFLVYADQQYYLAPNRYVRKERRSKWRFEVKRFIKDLVKVGGENSEEAGRLLAEIYNMLSYACHYRVFSTEDPFASVGYEQADLLQLVLEKMFYSGYAADIIKSAVFLTLDSNVGWKIFRMNLWSVLVDVLKTTDTKEIALAECLAYRNEYDAYQYAKSLFEEYDDGGYRRVKHQNYAVELYLLLKFALHEYDEGFDFYWKNLAAQGDDVKLYYLLRYFLNSDDKHMNALWIREYEKAVDRGIKPQELLMEEYAKRIARQ